MGCERFDGEDKVVLWREVAEFIKLSSVQYSSLREQEQSTVLLFE